MKNVSKNAFAFGLIISAVAVGATDPVSFLDGLTSHVTVAMATGSAVIVGGVVDFIIRLLPTKKPLSIAWIVANSLHSLGKLSEAVAQYMDKVLPQNTDNQNPKV